MPADMVGLFGASALLFRFMQNAIPLNFEFAV